MINHGHGPRHFLEAYVAARRSSVPRSAPARMEELGARAKMTFTAAAERDIEDSPLRIIPALGTYSSSVY